MLWRSPVGCDRIIRKTSSATPRGQRNATDGRKVRKHGRVAQPFLPRGHPHVPRCFPAFAARATLSSGNGRSARNGTIVTITALSRIPRSARRIGAFVAAGDGRPSLRGAAAHVLPIHASARARRRKAGRRRGFCSFGSPAVLARPVVFRPRLATGLAFREGVLPQSKELASSGAGWSADPGVLTGSGTTTPPVRLVHTQPVQCLVRAKGECRSGDDAQNSAWYLAKTAATGIRGTRGVACGWMQTIAQSGRCNPGFMAVSALLTGSSSEKQD